MKLLVLALGLALTSPLAATSARADPQPARRDLAGAGARLVPAVSDGTLIGLKVYAIQPEGRFAAIGFRNGDLLEAVDGEPVTTAAGAHALLDKVIAGTADASIAIHRKGKPLTLASKAVR